MLFEVSLTSWAVYSEKHASFWRPLILWSSYFSFDFYYYWCISLCEEEMAFIENWVPFFGMKKAERDRYWSGYLPSGLALTASSFVVNLSWEIIVDNDNNVGKTKSWPKRGRIPLIFGSFQRINPTCQHKYNLHHNQKRLSQYLKPILQKEKLKCLQFRRKPWMFNRNSS